jgi:polyhydroxybutyrate depolymerase
MERLTRLQAETDPLGWLVVLPDGVDRSWNDGRTGVGSDADDVAFLAAVLDDVAARTPVDEGRVFATGISNGAMMAGRLACDLADRIAGIAQVAGTQGVEAAASCAPSRPVPVLVIAGTADPLVPYQGGAVGFAGLRPRGTVVGVDDHAAAWRLRNGLGDSAPSVTSIPPDTTIRSWAGGPATAPVVVYRVEGGGHTWPSGRQYLPKALVGPTTDTFSASAVIVDFFARQAPRSPGS